MFDYIMNLCFGKTMFTTLYFAALTLRDLGLLFKNMELLTNNFILSVAFSLVIFLIVSILGFILGKYSKKKLPKTKTAVKVFAYLNFVSWMLPLFGFFIGFFTLGALLKPDKDIKKINQDLKPNFVLVALINLLLSVGVQVFYSLALDGILLIDYIS